MKTVYVSFFAIILFVLAISTDAKTEEENDCPKFCTFDYNPVCGYDGSCYRNYGNKCTLNVERCGNKKNLKAVDMDLCVQAQAKSNPNVIACDEEQ